MRYKQVGMELVPYDLVLPRDVFNHAKLLKCLGQLSLYVTDEKYFCLRKSTVQLKSPTTRFVIKQDSGSGDIVCTNFWWTINGRKILLASSLNSRAPYPLMFYNQQTGDWADVFNEKGLFTLAMIDYAEELAKSQPK